MEQNRTTRKQKAQQNYRKRQSNKGLVRFELQVSADAKKRFDALVDAAAEEFDEPWDIRQRIAKARAQVFEEITQGASHEFSALTDQIEALKAEIKALSPTFFKTDSNNKTPLPEAIRALPDNPEQLKAWLAKTYTEGQQAKSTAKHYKRQAEQYEQLYEVATDYNEELKNKLSEHEVFI